MFYSGLFNPYIFSFNAKLCRRQPHREINCVMVLTAKKVTRSQTLGDLNKIKNFKYPKYKISLVF